MAGAQFGDLAAAAGLGILVALAAGLRVVNRPQTVGDQLDVVELLQIGLERVGVDQAIGLAIEAGGGLLRAGGGHIRFRTNEWDWSNTTDQRECSKHQNLPHRSSFRG